MKYGKSARALLGALAVTLLLTGCGKVLDARNATINNGKIYEGRANEPFSGKVTNIKSELVWPFSERPILMRPLVKFGLKDDAEKVPVTFGESYCDLPVSDGVIDGQVVCKLPQSNTKRIEANFSSGRFNGKFLYYGPGSDSKPLVKAQYRDGVLDGDVEMFTLAGKLAYHLTWRNGKPQGVEEGWHPGTGNLIYKARFTEGLWDGEVAEYNEQGTLTHRQFYEHGRLNGPEEKFDDSSKLISHVMWKDDKIIASESWEGNPPAPAQSASAVPPQPAAKPAETAIDACVNQWISANRKGAGQDAIVMHDQIEEWEGWCAIGKRPA